MLSETFQVAAIIEKLPLTWKDFKNYLYGFLGLNHSRSVVEKQKLNPNPRILLDHQS